MKTSIEIMGLYTRFQTNPYEVLWYPMMTLFVKQVWPFQLIHLPFTQAQVVAQKIHDLWQSQIPNDHRQRHEVAHRGKVEGEQVDLSGSTEHWDLFFAGAPKHQFIVSFSKKTWENHRTTTRYEDVWGIYRIL